MIVVNWSAVVVLFCVRERLLRMVSKMRHVLFVLVIAVMSLFSHRVRIVTVEATVMHWAVIEVLRVVVSVMVSMLHLVVRVMVVRVVVLSNVFWLMHVSIDR